MSGLDGLQWEWVLGCIGLRGVAPERMPKAEATELAPENRRTPRGAISSVEGFLILRILW
jgi:hypothetical protein